MFAVGYGQLLEEILLGVEVAHDERSTPALRYAGQKLNGLRHIRALAVGMKVEHLAYDIENMLASFLWRNIFLYLIAEEDNTDLVVILYGRKSQGGCYLCHHVTLHLSLRAKVERTADVNHKHHCEFALFFKNLHVGFIEACRHIPVDITHVITILIFANLGKSHATPFEGRVILACKDI